MAADGGPSVPSYRPRTSRNPISAPLLDKIFARCLAILGVVFGLQALPFMIAQASAMQPVWAWTIAVAIFGGILACAIAGVTLRHIETCAAFIAITFLVALVTWPLAVNDPSATLPSVPWLWYIVTLGTACAALAFTRWIATGYLFVVPGIYAFIRMTPSGGGEDPAHAVLDSCYSVILGAIVLILITILRHASDAVDSAQNTAVARYSDAIREHATELERVQVDSIVHDSVLTTFLSAARAFTPEEQALATTMARNAMSHLTSAASVTPFDSTSTSLSSMRDRISDVATALSADIDIRARGLDHHEIPTAAAEALYSAAVQALVNSAQHAGDAPEVTRWVALDWTREAVVVEVGDTGSGFNPQGIPTERLGVRVSITERLANAGGEASIHTKTGQGTVVSLRWPSHSVRPTGAPQRIAPTAPQGGMPEGGVPEGASSEGAVSEGAVS